MNIDPDDIQGSIAGKDASTSILVEHHPVEVYVRFKGRNPTANLDKPNLQRYALFCAACAGKNSHQQSAKLDMFEEFLQRTFGKHHRIFDLINMADDVQLLQALKYSALGKYNLLLPGFKAIALDPEWPGKKGDRLAKVAKYSGYGIKTASLFNMHAFHEWCACLDTYILRWLAGDAMFHDAPIEIKPPSYKNVPRQSISNWDIYERWEDAFLSQCGQRGLSPLELDKQIWLHSRIKTEKPKTQELCLT